MRTSQPLFRQPQLHALVHSLLLVQNADVLVKIANVHVTAFVFFEAHQDIQEMKTTLENAVVANTNSSMNAQFD